MVLIYVIGMYVIPENYVESNMQKRGKKFFSGDKIVSRFFCCHLFSPRKIHAWFCKLESILFGKQCIMKINLLPVCRIN